MLEFIGKKLARCVLLLLAVSALSFFLISISGKDSAEIIARQHNLAATEEMIESTRVELGLNKPMPAQYFDWVIGFATGNLGVSIQTFNSISEDIAGLLPKTLALVGLSLIWILIFTVPLAVLCVRFKNSLFDQIVRVISLLGICIPTFWLGFMFLIIFAINMKLITVVPKPGLASLILPSIALAVPTAFSLLRQLRATLLDELSKDYIRYAKSRGLSNSRILICHALRNASLPIITILCQYLGFLVAGSVIVEGIFSIDGIGGYLVTGISNGDSRAVASCVTIIAVIFVISNMIGEVINRGISPWMKRETND